MTSSHGAMALGLVFAAVGSPALAEGDPYPGYTLYNTLNSNTTYLIDMAGDVVNTWTGPNRSATTPYLFPDGSILRPCRVAVPQMPGGATGGRIQIIAWDGTVTWDYLWSSQNHQQHHDVTPMPNGNVLLVAWERKSHAEALAMGRVSLPGEMWPTEIIEVHPTGPTSGDVVWEWHAWDHLIQDADPDKPNYGVVADHPELIDINLAAAAAGDWIHVNGIDYNEELDQIIVSSMAFSEIFIIDHSTTTEEAAGHTGGKSGMGGDLLYRWGNPRNYDRGHSSDRHLFGVHSASWIDPGLPGAGNLLIFNNGNREGSENDYSSAEELVPPLLSDGTYDIQDDEPFGPAAPHWIFEDRATFYSFYISGASRLPNGNTLICEGATGHLFEVTALGEILWEYYCGGAVMRGYRYDFDYLQPSCPGDIDGDGDVNVLDLVAILAAWGPCAGCPEDLDDDGVVAAGDLLAVLAAWGSCS